MENLTFAKNKTGWLGGIEISKTEEQIILEEGEYIESLAKIKNNVEDLSENVSALYEKAKRKELSDILINLHVINESI